MKYSQDLSNLQKKQVNFKSF